MSPEPQTASLRAAVTLTIALFLLIVIGSAIHGWQSSRQTLAARTDAATRGAAAALDTALGTTLQALGTLARTGADTASRLDGLPVYRLPDDGQDIPPPAIESMRLATGPGDRHLSRPFDLDGAARVALGRVLRDPAGRPAAYAVALVPVRRLHTLIEAADPPPGIRIELRRTDGTPVAGWPSPALDRSTEQARAALGDVGLTIVALADGTAFFDRWRRHEAARLVPLALAFGGLVALSAVALHLRRRDRDRTATADTAHRQAFEKWQRDRQRLLDAVDCLSEGFALWDRDDRLSLFNAPLHQFLDQSIIDTPLRNRRFEDCWRAMVLGGAIVVPPGQENAWLAECRLRHLDPDDPFEFQMTDGRWVRVAERRTREGGIVATYTDVTREKTDADHIRRQKESAETYLAIAGTLIIALDTAGRVTLINRKGCEILGYPEIEIVGRDWFDLAVPEDARETFRTALTDARAGRTPPQRDIEGEVITRDGSRRTIAWRTAPIPDGSGGIVGSLSSGEDITQRKASELALRQAKLQAETANRSKTEFLAIMSHELRTPLNSIIGFSDILASEMFGPLGSPEYVQYSRDINESGKHLLDIINDILDVARIESGALSLREAAMDVARLVQSTRRMVSERAAQADVDLRADIDLPDPPPALVGDERRLKQVLINLLSNAVKFTPRHGSIVLSVRLGDDDGFVFEVTDTGIGIAAENLERVLIPFGQADGSATREYDGVGLGLPLSRNLVDLHGGELRISSMPGEGTRVVVRMPPDRTRRLGA